MDLAPLNERRELAHDVFTRLCQVGGQLTADPSVNEKSLIKRIEAQRGVRAASRSVLAAIASAPEKLIFIANATGSRLEQGSDEPGAVVVGRVQSIMEVDSGTWALAMTHPYDAAAPPFTIHVAAAEMEEAISTGDVVIALGRMLEREANDVDLQNVHLRASVVFRADE